MRRADKHDIYYYVRGKKRPIAGSTVATSHFLGIVCEQHPGLTTNELKRLLEDKSEYIINPEAIAVLNAYIKAGCGDCIPGWKY